MPQTVSNRTVLIREPFSESFQRTVESVRWTMYTLRIVQSTMQGPYWMITLNVHIECSTLWNATGWINKVEWTMLSQHSPHCRPSDLDWPVERRTWTAVGRYHPLGRYNPADTDADALLCIARDSNGLSWTSKRFRTDRIGRKLWLTTLCVRVLNDSSNLTQIPLAETTVPMLH